MGKLLDRGFSFAGWLARLRLFLQRGVRLLSRLAGFLHDAVAAFRFSGEVGGFTGSRGSCENDSASDSQGRPRFAQRSRNACEGGDTSVDYAADSAACPLRPSLPYVLVCALGMWAAAALAYSCAIGIPAGVCGYAAVVSAGVSLAFVVCLRRAGRAYVWSALLGLSLGCCCAFAGACALHAEMDGASSVQGSAWIFTLEEDASSGTFGSQALARAVSPGGESFSVLLTFEECEGARYYGDSFSAFANFIAPRETIAQRCWGKGAAAVAQARNIEPVEREGVFSTLLDIRCAAIAALGAAGNDEGALLQALVCGSRAQLSASSLYDDFKATGLAHMVAVSGAHLVIVSGFVMSLLHALRAPKVLAVVLQVLFVLAYLVFAAAPVSAVRAAVMSIVGTASFFSRRRPAPLNALAVCIAGMVAVAPSAAVSISFALSAGSTLGIVLLSGLVASWFEDVPIRLPRFVVDALSLTFASSVVTMPASAALFAQASLIAPLANVVCAPLFAVACTGGLVAALVSVALPGLAPVACGAASAVSSILVELVHALASVPFACVPASAPVAPMIVLSVVLTAALWWFWPRMRFAQGGTVCGASAAVFALWVAISPLSAGSEIVMLDVGQGDAFLVRSEGRAILIDTGNRDQALREGLARHGVWRLDAVVISHADDDHCASLDSLRGVVDVGAVYVAADVLDCVCSSCDGLRASAAEVVGEDGVLGLEVGDVVRCGAIGLSVLWPYEFSDEGGNADSLCLLAAFDPERDGEANWTALFCGDAESKQLDALEESGALGEVNIYKVGHHGSRAALDDETVRALSPDIALVSVGASNHYGHPAAETLERLESVGARVLRTDEQGDVSCKLEADSISVTTLR